MRASALCRLMSVTPYAARRRPTNQRRRKTKMSDGSQFLGQQPKQDRWNWRPVQPSTFAGQRRTDAPSEGQDSSSDAYAGATDRVRRRLDASDGWRLFGIAPAPTVEDRAEHDLIDSAIGAEVERATYARPSRVERDRAYLQ